MKKVLILFALVLVAGGAVALAKPKTITLGRWFTVKWMVGPEEKTAQEIKVRALIVDNEPKEFTLGEPHEVTDRVFVVQQAHRLNDRVPDDPATKPQWSWRPGGWLMVQRSSARITKLNLPEYDPYTSSASWFRDYVAYCGVSDNADKLYAMVVQIGRKKPLVKKLLGTPKNTDLPHSECEVPAWRKQPSRVTFQVKGGEPVSFEVRNFASELPPDQGVDAESESQ